MIYLGFDFSCNKPALTILKDNIYSFYFFPLDIDKVSIEKMNKCNINVFNRTRSELNKNANSSDKFRWHIEMANQLSESIMFVLEPLIKNNKVSIAFEGSSFGSKGDAGLQLAGYRYILVNELGKKYGLSNIYTYAPLTIKSVAGCASKDNRGKDSMIKAFIESNIEHEFWFQLKYNDHLLRKKTNYIQGVDDLIDSYWVLETMRIKENI
jgi:hypothetical protein